MIPALDTPELVHVAMLRGTIATISLRQCAHVHGPEVMEAFNRWDELRGDIKTTMDVLWDFPGEQAWTRAQKAVERVEWLKRELGISQYNERAALDTAQQHAKELEHTKYALQAARRLLEKHDPLNARILFGPATEGRTHDEENARQASGLKGAFQKRTHGEAT